MAGTIKTLHALALSLRAQLVIHPDTSWKRIGMGIIGILHSSFYVFSRSARQRRKPRLDHCEGCQLFSPVTRTCGHVARVTGSQPKDMASGVTWVNPEGDYDLFGCGCLMDVKALLPHATCYLRDVGADEGWPDGI